jgi:putative DNA primase/helicase
VRICVTYWRSLTDTLGERYWYDTSDVAEVFDGFARTPHDGQGWSPGTFKGNRRNDESCERLFAIGIDCEHKDKNCTDDPIRLGCPDKLASSIRYAGFVHTTRNHRAKAPRSRGIVWLSRPVNAAEYHLLWARLADAVEAQGLRVDRSTHNESRLWYLPSIDAEGNPGRVVELDGDPLDVDAMLSDIAEQDRSVANLPPTGSTPTREPAAGDLYKRAIAYVDKIPGAVSGSGGHNQTFDAGRALVSFVQKGLPQSDAWSLLTKYNARCQPPWSAKELRHKWNQALKAHTFPALEDRPPPSRPTRSSSEPAPSKSKPARPERRPLTDLGNAERLLDQHGRDLRFVTGLGRMVWAGSHWEQDDRRAWEQRAAETVRTIYAETSFSEDADERKAIARHATRSESAAALRNMVALAENSVACSTDDLDCDAYALNVTNGTIDLRTGELREHRRDDLITKVAGCAFDPHATCPTFERFLCDVFAGNEELIGFVQRFMGYSLTGDVREQVLLFAFGTGANGKSTLIDLWIDLLGGFGGYAAPGAPGLLVARQHEQHPTELAALRGARAVTCVEIGDGKRFDEERVKALTGSDKVTARHMREDFFSFSPTHKLIVAANHRPQIRGTDLAIWRRILMVPFAVTFTDEQKDRDLPRKLRAELPGILAWAVRGCLDWQRGGLRPPAVVLESTQAYRAEQDVVGRFLADRCALSATLRARAGDLYQAFREWAEEQGEADMPARRFGEALAERGLTAKKGTAGSRWWAGVGLHAENSDQGSARWAS